MVAFQNYNLTEMDIVHRMQDALDLLELTFSGCWLSQELGLYVYMCKRYDPTMVCDGTLNILREL